MHPSTFPEISYIRCERFIVNGKYHFWNYYDFHLYDLLLFRLETIQEGKLQVVAFADPDLWINNADLHGFRSLSA